MDAARRSKRYPSEHPLLVRCESWTDFVAHYAADIGQGGMFIVTDEAPPIILSLIDVRMQLPEAVEIALKVRVVHVLEKEQCSNEHMRPGVGVEFVDLDPERKRQILQMIEFARWQGHDPNASLARTMLEHSNALSKAKVPTFDPVPAPPSAAKTPPHRADSARITMDGGAKVPASQERAPQRPDSARITMDGTSRTTMDGTSKPAPAQPRTQNPSEDPRKITLDGSEKGAAKRSSSSLPAQPGASIAPKARDSSTTLKPGDSSASIKPVAAQAAPAPKPSDAAKVKSVVTHFAHKRYDIAIRETAQMLVENPGDTQALKWQLMCKARQAVAANDAATAAQHYEKALEYDENNREARDFVRDHHRDKRINALPFGRYFTKKK